MIPVIEDKIRLRYKRDVFRLLLYIKLIEKGIPFHESELDVLCELHQRGGYTDDLTQQVFMDNCLSKGFRKSKQSIRNVLAKFVNQGVIKKTRNFNCHISHDYIPPVEAEMIGLMFYVSHAS